jgi:ABC-2 type transport system permease protein
VDLDDAALPGEAMPNSVQQNIPAWTLFAMFLIAIPLSGSIIKERDYGTLRRLRAMPISAATMLSAKIAIHVLVCLVQFGVMLLLGTFVLPLVGTPTLELGSHVFALLGVATASALAATGFGILVGSVAGTNEQASVFTATAVVIASGLGGLMVPSFLMPAAMEKIGRFMPLNWGLDAFLELLVRDGDLQAVLPQIYLLLAFFGVTTTLAVMFSARRT